MLARIDSFVFFLSDRLSSLRITLVRITAAAAAAALIIATTTTTTNTMVLSG
jgi:hypothetical protein